MTLKRCAGVTLQATDRLEHRASVHVVAASVGHMSISTTLQSYEKPRALAGAKQRCVLTVDGDVPASGAAS
jgi:hypothetical protein